MDLALIGTVSFGAVWIISYYANKAALKFWKKEYTMDTTSKLLLQGAIVFGLLFVPKDLGNLFLDNLKITIGVVTTAVTLYQGPKNVVKSLVDVLANRSI